MKNIIWLMTDQQRYDTTGVNGNKTIRTPVLDMLSREGVNFRNAYSVYPLCCLARGSILTSRYPHHCIPGHQFPLPQNQRTVAHVFSECGYNTFYCGKWHVAGIQEEKQEIPIGRCIAPRELRRGFETWLGYENNNAQYECFLHGHRKEQEIPLFRLKGYETDALTDLFLQEIRDRTHQGRPFFGVLSVQPPHDPYVAPPERDTYHNVAGIQLPPGVPDVPGVREHAEVEYAGYCSMLENIDGNVGRVLECLQELEIMDDTHLLFFSDHGDMQGAHGLFRKMTA